jgi:5-methylcytosine-specific restriction endonuclease McrA/predicted nucleic acid-binding Zn ribbon protein
MFSYSCGKSTVEFWIEEPQIQYFSEALKMLISAHGHCSACGGSISIDLRECPCRTKQRLANINNIEEILNTCGEDKKELSKATKHLWGYSEPRAQLEFLIKHWNQRTLAVVYGGKFEVSSEHWPEIDKLRILAQQKKYNQTAATYRKDRKSQAEGMFTKADIIELWQLQDGECYFCSTALKPPSEKHPFHIDHLIPLSLGGNEWPENLSLLCQKCNNVKYTKSEKEFWRLCETLHGKELIERQKTKAKMARPSKLKLSKARRRLVDENT